MHSSQHIGVGSYVDLTHTVDDLQLGPGNRGRVLEIRDGWALVDFGPSLDESGWVDLDNLRVVGDDGDE